MLLEYFTGFEHGGTTLSTAFQHEGCGFESRRILIPLNWCGPVTSPVRPSANNHGKYVLRLMIGKGGNAYYGLGAPDSRGIPRDGFVSNPLCVSLFYQHNHRNDFAPYTYGVCGLGSLADRYCELRMTYAFADAGRIQVFDSNGVSQAIGPTVLGPNAWYWIRLAVYKGATQADNYVEVYVDDTLQFKFYNIDLSTFSEPKFSMGGRWDLAAGHGGAEIKVYYDDVVIGNSWMPLDDYYVVYMVPNANGTHFPDGYWSPWNYIEVGERPHDGPITKVMPVDGYGEGAWWTCHVESCSEAGEHTGIAPKIFAVRNMIISNTGFLINHSKIRLKLADNCVDSPLPRDLAQAFLGQTRIFQNNPWSQCAWTTGMLNDLEVGTWVQDDESYSLTQAGIHVLFGVRPPYDENQSRVFPNFGR